MFPSQRAPRCLYSPVNLPQMDLNQHGHGRPLAGKGSTQTPRALYYDARHSQDQILPHVERLFNQCGAQRGA